ncbi:MAG: hypothetical protein ACYTEQ_22405 [Planctomycetota bacterium]
MAPKGKGVVARKSVGCKRLVLAWKSWVIVSKYSVWSVATPIAPPVLSNNKSIHGVLVQRYRPSSRTLPSDAIPAGPVQGLDSNQHKHK